MEQHALLFLFLILAGVAIIVFTIVFLSSKRGENDTEDGMANPLKKRFWFSLILFVILGIFLSVTLPKSPYYLFAKDTPEKVVHVDAMQFSFIMSENPIDPKNPAGSSIELPSDKIVEFRVTSLDVNHGFAIYNHENRLIAQTQAMPGYVNRLRTKFEPGNYNIFCLEYCGMAHHGMRSSFTVK